VKLALNAVTKSFQSFRAVDQADLQVKAGEFVALLGPSGCGKTTLLRMIAGFIAPDSGSVVVDGEDVTVRPPHERQFGVVFQNYALFPHMTVGENVAYGLKMRGSNKADRRRAAEAALGRVGLPAVIDRFPNQLSGGQQQRVALARALVIEPKLLLLDEPLSALDKNLREGMQFELRSLQQNLGVTSLFVTHDQEEAMTLADRIVVMNAGQIQQVGTPEEVYGRPANRFVAAFLGATNFLPARFVGREGDGLVFEFGTQKVVVPDATGADTATELAVRPENLSISADGDGLPCVIKQVLFQGHRIVVQVETLAGQQVTVYQHPAVELPEAGKNAVISIAPGKAHFLAH
jgi:putative spermidine/putrescine transport system ATP-binding protein